MAELIDVADLFADRFPGTPDEFPDITNRLPDIPETWS